MIACALPRPRADPGVSRLASSANDWMNPGHLGVEDAQLVVRVAAE
jgi:hypothetical protein